METDDTKAVEEKETSQKKKVGQGAGGGGPYGNKKASKLTDPILRQEAYKQYCDHLASGRVKESWWYDDGETQLSWETMEKWLENEEEFPPELRKIGRSRGYKHWEGVVGDSAIGTNTKANPASLSMIMRNKYGWDGDKNKTVIVDPEVRKSVDRLLGQVTNQQILNAVKKGKTAEKSAEPQEDSKDSS